MAGKQNIPEYLLESRDKWHYRGETRPAFADTPEDGQESVWDYPRPPVVAPVDKPVIVRHGDTVVARSRGALRVLETASPPTVYLPPADVRTALLEPAAPVSWCEWKGRARYWTVRIEGERLDNAAWSYDTPFPGFEAIAGFLSFYPARIECRVDDVRVAPQPGSVYGGWVTPELCGPFKGEPGTEGW